MDKLLITLITGLSTGSVIALMALGLALIFGVLRVVNFAHGSLFMLGAYACYFFAEVLGINYFLALLLSAAVIAVLSVIVGLGVFRRFHGMELEGAVASVALGVILESLAILVFQAVPRHVNGPLDGVVAIGTGHVPQQRVFMFVTAVILFVVLAVFIKKSYWGRALRAVQQDSDAASLQGISVTGVIIVAFTIAGAFAGLAGAFIAADATINPTMGITPLIFAFVAVVVGGMGNIWGALYISFGVGIIQSMVSLYWAPQAAVWVSFAAVLVILAIRSRKSVVYA